MTKCKGCGITLQDSNINLEGYTKDLNNKLCLRCFKLTHYNELINTGINISNKDIINKINKSNGIVLFLIDLLNIDKYVIDLYKSIKLEKMLVLTKIDIVPKNIKIDRLIDNIKNVYDIKNSIIPISIYKSININYIKELIQNNKVYLVGLSNMGKSSLINKLVDSKLTVSKSFNTTQDFIKIGNLIDTPGLMRDANYLINYKGVIKPSMISLKEGFCLIINDIIVSTERNTNITIYSKEILKTKKNTNINNKYIDVPEYSDLVLQGIGFIRFKNKARININIDRYEIRPSIIGRHL